MDVAYRGDAGAGAAVVLSYPGLEVLETKTILGKALVPYMPTFLAFREMPFLFKLFSRLDEEPSLFFINGHGVYHPAGLGLASHFGVAFGVPTIGVAGGLLRLKGETVDGGSVCVSGRKVCCAIREKDENDGCRAKGKVSYVSAGHRISLERAVEVARSCFRGHSTPEPLFLADQISKKTIGSANVYG